MKRKTLCSIVFAAILLVASECFAGDYAALNVLGFSQDGRYLAFEEHGTQDGSGFPYANIYFIDVAKNSFAAGRVSVIIEKETALESTAQKRAALLAAKRLRQLGIVRGNLGKLVVSHQLTDLTFSSETNSPSSVMRFAEEVGSMYRRGDYELSLTQTPTKTKDCDSDYEDAKLLSVKLTNKDDDTDRLLQKDTSLPSSRGCPLEYRMQDVYLYKDFIAVFIGVFTRGFEGPDMRFMVVTGKFK